MTLFLPHNFPKSEAVDYYDFDHNKTHSAMVLDYGSVTNHHGCANARAKDMDTKETQKENVHFQVRTGFPSVNHMF